MGLKQMRQKKCKESHLNSPSEGRTKEKQDRRETENAQDPQDTVK